MANNRRGINIISNDTSKESKQRLRRFKKYSANDRFKKLVTSIRGKIASGKNLFEIRSELESISENEWSDALYFFSENYYKTENMVLEWQLKQGTRYQLAAEAYNMAKAANDYDAMMRAVHLMNKLDEHDLNMKTQLGIIRPVKNLDEPIGEGINHDDLVMTERKFNELLEQRITTKLSLQREAEQPVTIDVLSRPSDERGPDNVGQTTLVENDPSRQLTTNQDSEGLSNGGFDLLHPMDLVARENKAR